MSESTAIGKGPCTECGSRDNCVLYSDGHTYCFGCQHLTHGDRKQEDFITEEKRTPRDLIPMHELEFRAFSARGLTLETAEKMKYGVVRNFYINKEQGKKTCQVATFFDAKTRTKPVAQHLRYRKDDGSKGFAWLGENDKAALYGMDTYRKPGKFCVITEGEIDQLSMAQVQALQWPVYSLTSGAAGAAKDIGRNADFLEQFEKVVFMFDTDEAGVAAVEKCVGILSPGKVGVATLPLKDANDMLKADRGEELIEAAWAGFKNTYRPDGVVTGESLWEAMTKEESGIALPFPWDSVNEKLVGIRPGQILLVPGGTGLGKSTIARDIAVYWHGKFDEKVGIIALEEALHDTVTEVIDTMRGERGSINLGFEDLRPMFDEHIGENWCFFNHMGAADFDTIENRMRYFAKVEGCGTIIFDHILAAVEGTDEENVNRAMERAMNRVRTLAQELQVRLIMPTHLKSVTDRAFEEGAAVRSADIKYPALRQYSNKILAVERNQQKEGSTAFNFRVIKNRGDGGLTGPAGSAQWNTLTNRIDALSNKNLDLTEEENEGGDMGLTEEELETAPF